MASAIAQSASASRLTTNQVRGFWAAWAGWALDGMDSFIYALVLVPALTELLPRSGYGRDAGTIGFFGGLLFALFLVGWGLSLVWGPIADRIGRVPALAATILCYSTFTFLGALAANVWMLAVFRLLAGVGIGGEWSMGGTFVAEEWPEERRTRGAGYMHTGYYVGFFLAAVANATIGARYGWRALFAFGGLPALLVMFVRLGVRESRRFQARAETARPAAAPLQELFSTAFRRRTLLNASYVLVSIVGLWAGSVYVPAAVTHLAGRAGYSAARAAGFASWGTILLSIGTITGCLVVPELADRWGRRPTLAAFFALMAVSIWVSFGWAFYLREGALGWFLAGLFVLGFGGANFALYTLWLPEQYPTSCRATAFAFVTSVGRFVGAGITFLVGAAVARFGSIGMPVALTALAFVAGLLLVPFAEETRGRALPD